MTRSRMRTLRNLEKMILLLRTFASQSLRKTTLRLSLLASSPSIQSLLFPPILHLSSSLRLASPTQSLSCRRIYRAINRHSLRLFSLSLMKLPHPTRASIRLSSLRLLPLSSSYSTNSESSRVQTLIITTTRSRVLTTRSSASGNSQKRTPLLSRNTRRESKRSKTASSNSLRSLTTSLHLSKFLKTR